MTRIRSGSPRVVAGVVAALVYISLTPGLLSGRHVAQEGPDVGVVTVSLQVETTTGSQATIRAKDGGRLTVTTANGESVALTPVLIGDQLEVRITDLSVAGTEIEMPPLTLTPGIPATLAGVPAVSRVKWVSLTVSNSARPQRPRCDAPIGSRRMTDAGSASPQPDSPCSLCCVSCDGILYCGCAVITACGACCCPYECSC